MKTLDRKLLREMWQHKWLLLAVTSIIAVGVTCFTAMQSAYHNLNEAKLRFYRQSRMADFWIELEKMPVAEMGLIARSPGIAAVQPRIQFAATVDLEGVARPLNGQVISLPARREPVINDILLVQGGYFTDRRENEVIVADSFARAHDLQPGMWIHLLLNNRRQELFIVGTAKSSEYVYMVGPGALIPDPSTFGVFYLKQHYAEEVFDMQGAANQVVGKLTPAARRQPRLALRLLEDTLDSFGVISATPLETQPSNQFLSSEIEGLGAFATVVPTIFLAVAAVVLNVLLTRLARQQRVSVGTLKALGYGDGQIFRHFLKYGAVVGIAGGAVGGLLGYFASTGMTVVYRNFFELPNLVSGVYPRILLTGVAVSMACAVLGSAHGASMMLRLRPAEAMRSEPPKIVRSIWLERLPWLWSQLSSAWRLCLRDMSRHKVRTTATLFAAAMGAALLTTGFMLLSAQNYLLEFQFHRISRSDIDLHFKDPLDREALAEVRSLPAVDHALPTLDIACTFYHGAYQRKGAITGLPAGGTLTRPRDSAGEPIALPASGIIMTRQMAKLLHVGQGDVVMAEPVKGDQRLRELRVVKIADSYMGTLVYAELEYLSGVFDEQFAMTGAQLLVDPHPERRRALYQELNRMPAVQQVVSRREMVENLTEQLLQVQWAFISVLILFAGTIFFGSLLNASMVNLTERQREVATFRALGYTPWRIGGAFLRESMLCTLAGGIVGLPLGYGLTLLTAWSYANDMIRLPVVLPGWVPAATVLLAIAFGLLAHAVVQWRIHGMNFVEALKVKE